MLLPRLYSCAALRTVPLVLVVLCVGCWEKIEYTGPGPSPLPPRTPQPSTAAGPQETAPPSTTPAPSIVETPPVAVEPTEPATATSPPAVSTNTPPTVEATRPKSDDDRYATPASDSAPTPPVPPSSGESDKPAPAAIDQPATPHTDATPASATAEEAAPPANAINSRRAAWLLGSRLCLAALANDRSIAKQNVPIWLGDARKAAKMLGATVLDLPEPAVAGKDPVASPQVIKYLIASFQQIGRELSKQHGPEESNLFEMALTSNMLLLLYSPGTHEGISLTETISKTGPQTKLPAELWQPLVDLVNKNAPETDVRAAVRKMHVDVDRYLAERAEPKGQ